MGRYETGVTHTTWILDVGPLGTASEGTASDERRPNRATQALDRPLAGYAAPRARKSPRRLRRATCAKGLLGADRARPGEPKGSVQSLDRPLHVASVDHAGDLDR